MVAEGVTLTNASWGSRPDLARVRKLTLFLDPASLFLGEVKIGRVLLEGADILVERNDVGDANLDMLPPPDGSGPHPGENRSLRLRTSAAFPWINTIEVRDSVLTIAEGQGRPPVVLEIPARDASSRRRPTSRCSSKASSRRRRPRRSSSPARPARSTAGCGDCPATSMCRAASAAARSRSRAASAPRAPACRSRRRARTSRCSAPTSACRCRPAVPTRSMPRPAPCAATSRSS